MIGDDQRPLVVRKGKKGKDEEKRREREIPPDAPIIDVSGHHY